MNTATPYTTSGGGNANANANAGAGTNAGKTGSTGMDSLWEDNWDDDDIEDDFSVQLRCVRNLFMINPIYVPLKLTLACCLYW